MKLQKALSLTLGALLLSSALALPASAMKAVGNVNVPYGTPKIDGTIDAAEWKSASSFTIDANTAKAWSGAVPADLSAKVQVLWDNTSLYVAGTVKDANVTCSTEGKYDKDAFQLSLDLGQTFYDTTESRSIFYSFGCYEDGTGILQRQESKNNAVVNDGENGLAVKTRKTADGWSYELAIPFAMLKEDCKLKSGKDIAVAAGTKINVLACYLDFGADGKLANALGTTATDEGTKFDWGPKDHGITFTLEAKKAVTAAPATADPAVLALLAAAASGAAALISRKRK